MLQQNASPNQSSFTAAHILLPVQQSIHLNRNDDKVKACKHRIKNGWCTKSQRQCVLSNLVFINH
ncbi:MAG: hypothetical protein QM726_10990 [Chitinophagaceae bacterium]